MNDFGGDLGDWLKRYYWGIGGDTNAEAENYAMGLISSGEPPKKPDPNTLDVSAGAKINIGPPVPPKNEYKVSAIIQFDIAATSRDKARKFATELLGEHIRVKLMDVVEENFSDAVDPWFEVKE